MPARCERSGRERALNAVEPFWVTGVKRSGVQISPARTTGRALARPAARSRLLRPAGALSTPCSAGASPYSSGGEDDGGSRERRATSDEGERESERNGRSILVDAAGRFVRRTVNAGSRQQDGGETRRRWRRRRDRVPTEAKGVRSSRPHAAVVASSRPSTSRERVPRPRRPRR
jgi:hypothetical protein